MTSTDPFEAAVTDYLHRQHADPTRRAIAHRPRAAPESDEPDALTRAVTTALNKGRRHAATEPDQQGPLALNSEALENHLRADLGA